MSLIDSAITSYTRVEHHPKGFQFPAQFEFIMGYYAGVIEGFTRRAPFPGVHFTLSAHRSATRAAEVTYSYHVGLVAAEEVFMVTTPGNASREFPIGQNTLHNAIVMVEYTADLSDDQLVENLPASTPTLGSYTVGDELIISSGVARWKGPIYRKEVWTIAEEAP